MCYLNNESRFSLAWMTARILDQAPANLVQLDLGFFSQDKAAEDGSPILEALSSATTIKHLKVLRLPANESWWQREGAVGLLCNLISRQDSLDELNIAQSDFSAGQTEQVLQRIVMAPFMSTLQTLNLSKAANFEYDASCEHLANILDKASNLMQCEIVQDYAERRISVEIHYATWCDETESIDEKGSIKVINMNTFDEICRVDTCRTDDTMIVIRTGRESIVSAASFGY